MTDEELVKQKWPDARAMEYAPLADWWIATPDQTVIGGLTPGWKTLSTFCDAKRAAWADAASRLEKGTSQ